MADGPSHRVAELLQNAVAAAKTRSLARVTADQLLIDLLHDPTTRGALVACGADLEALEQELIAHLDTKAGVSEVTAPRPDETLTRILRRIALSWEPRKANIGGLDIVMSMLMEYRLFAAQAMRSQGVSLEALQTVAFPGEDSPAASHRAAPKPNTTARDIDSGWLLSGANPSVVETRTWWLSGRAEPKVPVVEVRSRSGEEVCFHVALHRDGRLSVLEEKTPWQLAEAAETIVALFEVVGEGEISADLSTEGGNGRKRVSSFSGRSGMLADPGSRLQLLKNTMPIT